MAKTLNSLALLVASALVVHAQSAPRADASAVWQIPQGFVAGAQSACGSPSASHFCDCVLQQMTKAGAAAPAVAFTRELLKQSRKEIGIMTSFQHGTPVDNAWVIYPWRPDHRYGLLLLNGQPPIVDLEDLKLLDLKSMHQSLQYKDIQKSLPKLDIYPGDRDGKTYPNSQSGSNGGTQYILVYPLRNGCPSCGNGGSAMFTWNFDNTGKFLGTSFMGLLAPPLN
jgi:hypothetical protein